MKSLIKSFFLFVLCVLNLSCLFAQGIYRSTDSLASKIISYGKKNAPSSLFTCFDKTVYVNNESVWFTAYLLNYSKPPYVPTILSAILINDQTGSIALEQKFEIVNGLSFGHAIIPDSIAPGDYSFITYTNILTNGIPKDVFVQPITIKSASETPFFTSLRLVDSAKADNSQRIVLAVETKDHLPIKGATATWHVGLVNDKISSGSTKTDAEGKYIFSISRNQIEPGRNFLNVWVTYKNEVRNVKMLLPVNDKKLNIKFYPEGGNLVEGLVSTIGWEAKTVYGRPVSVSGVLYQDNHAVDTIQTDGYGMGRFKVIPHLGSKYELKLVGYAKDISYALPTILSKGLVISAYKAISDDSLQLKLVSRDPGKFMVMIHNFKQVFYFFPVEVTASGQKLLINLADVPKGLSTITVLDSLQRPCAERIFFAHYNRRSPLSIATDRPEYTTRQKVHIKLKLLPAMADSLKGGIVTVACVQSQKIETKKANDIESYFYLKQQLEALPVREAYMGESADDKGYLEKILLIKGWRKYSWQNMARDNAKDNTVNERQLLLNGSVTRNEKQLKQPIELIVMTDSATKIITTDASGDFQLNNNAAITAERKKLHLMLADRMVDAYKIKMKDSFNIINTGLINGFKPVNYSLAPVPVISSDSATIKGLNHVINLKEVKITGKKDDLHNLQQTGLTHKNECGDYVCKYGILNCLYHPNGSENQPAVVGEIYRDEFGRPTLYTGCVPIPNRPSTITVEGINYPKEFYGSDYSVFNPPEPEYQSTIFWKHACSVNSKETDLEFYTSDVTGAFSIIVQGVSSNGLIYEKKEFLVNKK